MVRKERANGDDVIGRVEEAAGVALERLITHGRVGGAADVAEERIKTIGSSANPA